MLNLLKVSRFFSVISFVILTHFIHYNYAYSFTFLSVLLFTYFFNDFQDFSSGKDLNREDKILISNPEISTLCQRFYTFLGVFSFSGILYTKSISLGVLFFISILYSVFLKKNHPIVGFLAWTASVSFVLTSFYCPDWYTFLGLWCLVISYEFLLEWRDIEKDYKNLKRKNIAFGFKKHPLPIPIVLYICASFLLRDSFIDFILFLFLGLVIFSFIAFFCFKTQKASLDQVKYIFHVLWLFFLF